MKINFCPISSTSFQGKCNVGKDYRHKLSIASNIITSSDNVTEAEEKAKILNETAEYIAQTTPENSELYIDLMPCEKVTGFLTILPHRQYIALYSKEDNNDVCIARDCINLMSPNPDLEFFRILAKKITNPIDGYHEISKKLKLSKKIPSEITSQEILKPIVDILI